MRLQADFDERLGAIADAVLEGILNEDYEQKRWQHAVGQYVGRIKTDAHVARIIAHGHKLNVVA